MSIYGNHPRNREGHHHPQDDVERIKNLAHSHKKDKEKGRKLLKFCLGEAASAQPEVLAEKARELLAEIGVKPEKQEIFIKRVIYQQSKDDVSKEMRFSIKHIELALEKTVGELYHYALKRAKKDKGYFS